MDGTNDWVWTYNSGQFLTDFDVTAFGLNFVNPYYAITGRVGLSGFDSGINSNGSFFGIATDDGATFNSITYTQYSTYQGFDNVTYSTTPNGNTIPEPTSLYLLGIGVIGFGIARRKRIAGLI